MTLGTDLKDIASEILTEFGVVCTFTPRSAGTYNVSTSGTTSADGSTYTGRGHPSNYSKEEIDGELIRQNDIRLIVEQTSSRPQVGDKVAFNSITYRILNVGEYQLQGTSVVYTCQVRA